MRYATIVSCFLAAATTVLAAQDESDDGRLLQWNRLPDLPNELGVAGPFAGVHADALLVAGGANFTGPFWARDKVWHDEIHVLVRHGDGYEWIDGGTLPRRIAHGAAVSTRDGIVCMGGSELVVPIDKSETESGQRERQFLQWESLPDLPDELGLGGPFAGVHNDALIVAGGANFPKPVWENEKYWHDPIYVLVREGDGFTWKDGGRLPRKIAYGATVSTPGGIVCMGGNDGERVYSDVFLLTWDPKAEQVSCIAFPPLPRPCAYGQAVMIDQIIYLAGGQSDVLPESAMKNFWSLDLSQKGDPAAFAWRELPPWPGPPRAYNITARQHNGDNDCVYVMSGRRLEGEDTHFLQDVWEYTPLTSTWRTRNDAPRCFMAGEGVDIGPSHILVLGGADGSLFDKADELRDDHPGFPKQALAYNAITDTWITVGPIPRNHVTTTAVKWDDRIVLSSGEVRPRVRSSTIWSITPALEEQVYSDVFLLGWDKEAHQVTRTDYPSLPEPCAYGQAVMIGEVIYLAGGQSDGDLESAMKNLWSLDLSEKDDPTKFAWKELPPWPGPPRAFNVTVHQHNGYNDCVYVMSGRRQEGDGVQPLRDAWEYTPVTGTWRARSDAPRCLVAGHGIGIGQSHLLILGGADDSLVHKTGEPRDDSDVPAEALTYHTITDTWTSGGPIPGNQVATIAVKWNDRIVLPSGQVQPRESSPAVWSITPTQKAGRFGVVDYTMLFGYLLAMVGVGVYFTKKNKSTDDFFRGGKQVVWWAAGCSIFATMLSSLTFTGIPSKAFAQDWVYTVGNFMIPVVAFIAVYVALPFYRQMDVTSAYEYLERRFSRPVRLFGSASFTLFHIFRMAVVMSLTGLALAVATPLTPAQSVLLMGILSIIYCTMGGVEAVIWTDTIQTIVLLGGAILAFILLLSGVDGGVGGFVTVSMDADKFRIANFNWDVTSAQIALWVIIIGGIGQNISSYTADQAVVQRYMTTPNQNLAARAIWTNAILAIPASLIFFGIGTALFAFYHSHPDKLDPTITTDQVFPLFIATEMPIGLAGLIVAGIFAAAQSTVSTSMNSTATTIVTDFMRPFHACRSERGYLNAARLITFVMGVLGTLLGLVFVDPEIKSLFDAFLKVIGLFMGVLGGLFVLGVMTRRVNAACALVGVLVGATVMFCLWKFTNVNGYIYTASGIATCFLAGLLASYWPRVRRPWRAGALLGADVTVVSFPLILYIRVPSIALDVLICLGVCIGNGIIVFLIFSLASLLLLRSPRDLSGLTIYDRRGAKS